MEKGNFTLKRKKVPKNMGNQEGRHKNNRMETYWKSQGVNEMIYDGSLLLSHVKMRLSKISLFDPLKIAKFFAKRTFRVTAQER